MVEDIKTPEEERKQTFWSRIGWVSKALIIIIIGLMWYATSITGEVPNKTYTNTTNLVTNTTTSIAHTRYNETSDVPKGSIDPSFAFFQTILFIVLIYLLVGVERKVEEYITMDEAIKIIKKQIMLWQRDDMFPRGNIFIKPHGKLTHYVTGGQRVPFKYVLDVRLQNDETGLDEYIVAEVNAKTKYIIGFLPVNKPLDRADTCGNCGHYTDIKVLTAEQFREFRKIRQDLGGRT